MGKLSEIRCLSMAGVGEKATKIEKIARIRCLSMAGVGEKATKIEKIARIRCLSTNFFLTWAELVAGRDM